MGFLIRIILPIFLIHSFCYGQDDNSPMPDLSLNKARMQVMNLEKELEERLERTLTSAFSHPFSANVRLNVDIESLMTKNELPKKTEGLGYKLPGIPFEDLTEEVVEPVEISKSSLLPYISTATVYVSTSGELSDKAKAAVRRIVSRTIKVTERVDLEYAKTNGVSKPPEPREKLNLNPVVAAIKSTGEQLRRFYQANIMRFVKELGVFKIVGLCVIIVLIILVLWVNATIKRAGRLIHSAISTFEPVSAAPAPTQTKSPPERARPAGHAVEKRSSFEDAVQKIKGQIGADASGLEVVVEYITSIRRFDMLAILLSCTEDRSHLIAEVARQGIDDSELQRHLRSSYSRIFTDPAMAGSTADELLRLLWLAKNDRDSILQMSIEKTIRAMDDQQILQLIDDSSPEELGLFGEFIGAGRLAKLATSNGHIIPKIAHSGDGAAVVDIAALYRRLVRGGGDDATESGEPLALQVARHLPSDLEQDIYRVIGPDAGRPLAQLCQENTEGFFHWFNALPIEDASQLIPALPNEIGQWLLNHLPDIKARRLASRAMELTERSLELKAELVNHLSNLERASESRIAG